MEKSVQVNIFIFIAVSGLYAQSDFKETQQNYQRVKSAYLEKENSMAAALSGYDLEPDRIEIYLRAFKQENLLEVWVREKGERACRYHMI